MIRGVHHIAVTTGDLDRLARFYCELLGFEMMRESSWEQGSALIDSIVGLEGSAARTATLRAGNLYVEMFQYASPTGRPNDPDRPVSDHGYTHFCLDVIDIDAEYERLTAAGMRFHTRPPPASTVGGGAIRATYGRDPDGNVIELQEIVDDAYPLQLDLS
jgi:catechol 2,3-dioxygenase-like lactoylglutathione lyase family enzyme